MFSSLDEELFFSQKVIIKKKYSNTEINLYKFFVQKTRACIENILIVRDFIFFFVKSQDYFKAKKYLNDLRKIFKNRKIVLSHYNRNNSGKLLTAVFSDVLRDTI